MTHKPSPPATASSPVRVRPYAAGDREACLAIFDGNTPRYFGVHERPEFAAFLDGGPGRYMVLEAGDQVVGCGGWHGREGLACLSWGMVAADRHAAGLGRRLLEARLSEIRADGVIPTVRLNTSQHSAGFFERFGFVRQEATTDGFGPGLDDIAMISQL